MKAKLLKKIRQEYHIKYTRLDNKITETAFISKDFKRRYDISNAFFQTHDLIFFIECYMLITMTKFKEIRTIRKNKKYIFN